MLVPDVLTLLFTDIEGSTLMWERDAEAMDQAVALHFEILERHIAASQGQLVKHTGDGTFAVFGRAEQAVRAAAAAEQELLATSWPTGELRVRMGMHTGECTARGGDYYGRAVNRAARLEQAAYGGQVLLSATTADLVREQLDAGLGLTFLGDHHFDGLLEPERVFQLTIPGLPAHYPPLRARDVGIGRLPLEMTPLIGRSEAADSIAADLGTHRVVTLVGPPGVGKSRLALRVATEVGRTRSSGVRFVDLTACRRIDAAEAMVATALGVRPEDEASFLAGIVRSLRATDTLLVLDNCEHLLAAVAPLVEAIVAACPHVSVLAASRQRLGLGAEVVRAVEPLEVPPGDAGGAQQVARSAAAELLVERARAVSPGFALTGGNAGAIASICRRCDGLPLAIELAGARLATLSPAELSAALEESLEVLEGPTEGIAHGRHTGLRDALDSSYADLSGPERALFDELAVFAGYVPATAVAAVCRVPPDEVRTLLEALERRSLLSVRRSGESTWYRLLESVRDYALAHGAADEDLHRRHADHFVEVAERRGRQYLTAEAISAAAAMAEQFDDLRLAFQRLVDWEQWSDATRIVLALHPFCLLSMRTELQTWASSLDGRLPLTDPRRAEIGGVLAIGAWFRGDHQLALARGRAALADAAEAEGPVFTMWAHTAMLNAYGFLGDFENAVAHLVALTDECRATGDPYWLVNALAVEAVANASAGFHRAALRPAAEAVRIAEELGNPECRYWAMYAQALALRPTDLDGAELALDKALAAARSNGSRFNEGIVLMEQLSVQAEQGRVAVAAATALDLLGHLERAGGFAQIWLTVILSSRVLAEADQLPAAALLLHAVGERPRLPNPETDALIADLDTTLEQGLGADELARIRTRARFLTDAEIIDTCTRELERVLWSSAGAGAVTAPSGEVDHAP